MEMEFTAYLKLIWVNAGRRALKRGKRLLPGVAVAVLTLFLQSVMGLVPDKMGPGILAVLLGQAIVFSLIAVHHFWRAAWEEHNRMEEEVGKARRRAEDLARVLIAEAQFGFMLRIISLTPDISRLPLMPVAEDSPADTEDAKRVHSATRRFQILYEEYLMSRAKFSLPVPEDPVDPLPSLGQAQTPKEQVIRGLRLHIEALRSYFISRNAELYTTEPRMEK